MFNYFRKNHKLTSQDLHFLESVVKSLPSRYHYLIPQVNKAFILDKKPNELGEKGTYVLVLNSSLEKVFIRSNVPEFFIIQGVKIWSVKHKNYVQVELHVLQGMLCGYLLKSKIKDIDTTKINNTHIHEKHFNKEEQDELEKILCGVSLELRKHLEVNGTFKIELKEGVFYTIKNLEDGNYLAVNSFGQVFQLTHDPYEVKKISNHISELKILN